MVSPLPGPMEKSYPVAPGKPSESMPPALSKAGVKGPEFVDRVVEDLPGSSRFWQRRPQLGHWAEPAYARLGGAPSQHRARRYKPGVIDQHER